MDSGMQAPVRWLLADHDPDRRNVPTQKSDEAQNQWMTEVAVKAIRTDPTRMAQGIMTRIGSSAPA
jgi:hypothetical protein